MADPKSSNSGTSRSPRPSGGTTTPSGTTSPRWCVPSDLRLRRPADSSRSSTGAGRCRLRQRQDGGPGADEEEGKTPPRGIGVLEDGRVGGAGDLRRGRGEQGGGGGLRDRSQQPHPRSAAAWASRTCLQIWDEEGLQRLLREIPDTGALLASLSANRPRCAPRGPGLRSRRRRRPAAARREEARHLPRVRDGVPAMSDLRLDFCSHDAAKHAVMRWHYSRTMPKCKLVKIGVWEDDRFRGAVIYGLGSNRHIARPFGLKDTEVCELVRVALAPWPRPPDLAVRGDLAQAPPPAIARPQARRLLRRRRPGPRGHHLPGRRLALPRRPAIRATSGSAERRAPANPLRPLRPPGAVASPG